MESIASFKQCGDECPLVKGAIYACGSRAGAAPQISMYMATSFLHSLGATLKTGLKYLGCSTPDLLNTNIHSTQVCIVMIIMPNHLPVAC